MPTQDEPKRKVLVFDDNVGRAEDWAASLRANLGDNLLVEHVELADFAEVLHALSKRRSLGLPLPTSDAAGSLDVAHIVVVDSDIDATDPGAPDVLKGRSGAKFAEMVRHYSDAGLVLVVNENGASPYFDLTMADERRAIADLVVDEDSMARAALWGGEHKVDGHSFFPSYWPRAAQLADSVELVIAEGQPSDLDRNVLEFLGIAHCDAWMTPVQRDGLLSGDPNAPGSTGLGFSTLGELCARSYKTVNPKEDVEPAGAHHLRVALFAVSRWLRRELVPPLNVFSDAIHLPMVVPEAFDERTDPAAIGGLLSTLDSLELDGERVGQVDLERAPRVVERLAGRPLWVVGDPDIDSDGMAIAMIDYRLAEDVTTYLGRHLLQEFSPDIGGAFGARFVVKDRGTVGVPYRPRSRLS